MLNTTHELSLRSAPTHPQIQMAARAAKRVCRGLATVACAPSKNLNVGFPHFATARELYDHIRAISKNESKEAIVFP